MDIPEFMNEWEFWVAALSTLAAWAAALFAWSTHRATRRQLQLSIEAHERQGSPLTLQVSDSFSRIGPQGESRLLAFSLVVTNPADAPNAVNTIELMLDYELDNGDIMTAVSRPQIPELEAHISTLSPPVRLDARSSEAGWVFFTVDYEIARRYRIRGYRVSCTDTSGRETAARSIIIRELVEKDGEKDQTD